MLKPISGAMILMLSLTGSLRAQVMDAPDTMVIIDASNSMWGQIDGVSKMEIARGVIGDLTGDLNTESDFGLIAYGHRRTSDCGDIEVLLPVAPLDSAAFSAAVNRLQPRGRTPLTAAVELAAQTLDSTNRSARIIVLTDGLESCDADPCALASALEASGLDFTTHVIGFGVSEIADQSQISCLAENTGGVYLTADTADELSSALEFMAMPMPAAQLVLRAVDGDGNVIDDRAIEWSIFNLSDQEMWLRDEIASSVSLEYQADSYRATARLGDQITTLEFEFDGAEDAVFDLVFASADSGVEIIESPEPTVSQATPASFDNGVTVDAPNNRQPGEPIEVIWDGPSNSGDYIAIAAPDDAMTRFSAYARTSAGNPAILTAPDTQGIYEIRYISPTTGEVLATDIMVIGDIKISFTIPDDIRTQSGFSITWDGPVFDGDQLVFQTTDRDVIATINATDAKIAEFTAPETAGRFEILYQNGAGETLETAGISIAFAASIIAQAEAVAGSDITIGWTGPDKNGDTVTIVPESADSNIINNFGLTADGDQLKITTPDIPGTYEIRYVLGENLAVIASETLTLTAPVVTIEAPAESTPGALITVIWQGPNNQNDYLTIVPQNAAEGASDSFYFARQGSPVTVELPDTTGEFEIRYMTGQSGLTLARAPVSINREPTIMAADETAIAGSVVMVSWLGPHTADDIITLVPIDTADDVLGNFSYTREGSGVGVISENSIGEYELRYISGATAEVLAILPIALVAPPVTLLTNPQAVAGGIISVEWDGPDFDDDYITIVPVDAAEGEFGNYTYTRNGSPLDLITKDAAGDYEIRYVSGETRETLARVAMVLTEPESSLETVAETVAGAEIAVTWSGPDHQNDLITVVTADTPEGEFGNFVFTRRGADLSVLTPDIPGQYEVRYLSGQSYRTLASQPVTLTAPDITIDAWPVGVAGTNLAVIWTGPSNKNDFLTIVPVDAPQNALGAYQYTRKGNPLELMLPDTAGAFEIRYVSGQSMRALQSLPLTIIAQ
ncbi:MAG: VWA domain-containing protein [Rhodobacteraceae bacterium]|nr:VWA domain-containing protein [Paracoccaceae bacterium]